MNMFYRENMQPFVPSTTMNQFNPNCPVIQNRFASHTAINRNPGTTMPYRSIAHLQNDSLQQCSSGYALKQVY